MSAAVVVRSLTRAFPGGGGIHDVHLAVDDRAVTAIVGPNGAGKTVLLSIVAGLARADSGAVELGDADARVALCPDVPQFEPWLTAREVVETSLALTGVRGTDAARDAVRAALASCGIEAVAERRVGGFSRGMLQRLGMAAALVADPAVLILDEPSSALDPIGRSEVRDLIAAEGRRRCVILSSHALGEVEQVADRVVVLDRGRVVADGSTAEVLGAGLAPEWTIRLAGPSPLGVVPSSLGPRQAPDASGVVRLERVSDEVWTVRFESFDAAADGLLPVLESLRAPIVEVTLRDRDLDASFARLVRERIVA